MIALGLLGMFPGGPPLAHARAEKKKVSKARPKPVRVGSLTFRWTSVAGFLLDDGETTLSFDPTFSRPGIGQWLGLMDFVPDVPVVSENVHALELTKLDAVFVSHEHFDHAVDAPLVAHALGATLYGGLSLARVASANIGRFGWTDFKFREVADRETVQVGKFRIKVYRRTHAAIFPLIGFHFLGGEVPANFDFSLYDYREGDVYCWLIEHPAGRIFVDQGSHFFEGARPDLHQGDTMLLGVANKKSVADFVEKYIGGFHPKFVIPLHFDFFFGALNRGHAVVLPGIQYDQIVSESAKVSPESRFRLPKFGERIPLSN